MPPALSVVIASKNPGSALAAALASVRDQHAAPAELIVVPGAAHVFPNLAPEKRLELIGRINAFLDKHSGKKK